MAASPQYKVYTANGEYEAACKSVKAAAAVVTFLGEGATIRAGHRKRDIVWTEGEGPNCDGPSRLSDRVIHVVEDRIERWSL